MIEQIAITTCEIDDDLERALQTQSIYIIVALCGECNTARKS